MSSTAELAGSTVTLKLKSADFKIKTRAQSLNDPTQLAAKIFDVSRELLRRETDGTRYRLIGVGVSQLVEGVVDEPMDLIDHRAKRSAAAEQAIDRAREKFGRAAVIKGLVFDGTPQADEDEE